MLDLLTIENLQKKFAMNLFQNLPDQIADFSNLLRTNTLYIDYANKNSCDKVEEFSIRNKQNRELFFVIKTTNDKKNRGRKRKTNNIIFSIYSTKQTKLLKLVVVTRPSFLKLKLCKVKIYLGNRNHVGEIVSNYVAKCSLQKQSFIVYDNSRNAILFIKKVVSAKRWIIYSSNRVEVGKIQFYDRKVNYFEKNIWTLTFPLDLDLRCKLLLLGAVFFFESNHCLKMRKSDCLQNFKEMLSCFKNYDSDCGSSSEEESNKEEEPNKTNEGFDTNWTS